MQTITKYRLDVNFIASLLGTQPDPEVAKRYITSKFEERQPEPNPEFTDPPTGDDGLPVDETETLNDALDKGTTGFHRSPSGKFLLYDYIPKGMLKSAGRVFNGAESTKNLKWKIEHYIFIRPRRIELVLPPGGELSYLERPIRVETAQGPRVALARSEQLPEGTSFTCEIHSLSDGKSAKPVISEKLLRQLLDYGVYNGIGQWRGASFGTFEYELTEL